MNGVQKGASRRTCVRLEVSERLTASDPTTAASVAASYEGQAHFAKTGPDGATCRECSYWCRPDSAKGGAYGRSSGWLKPKRCRKYRKMSGGKTGKGIPHDAGACKYFERHPSPPAAFIKPRNRGAEK